MTMEPINLKISMPSVALKLFIERIIKDDDFFALAMENPLTAFTEAGVNLSEDDFVLGDFAKFFAVLARLKERLGGTTSEKLNFEAIFGVPAEVTGTNLKAETSRGFYRDWGGKQAVAEKEICISTSKEFGQDAISARELLANRNIAETRLAVIDVHRVGESTNTTYKYRSSDLKWDKNESVQEVGMKTGTSEDFETSGTRLRDLMRGPLIHPAELAAVTARIEAFVDIVEGTKR